MTCEPQQQTSASPYKDDIGFGVPGTASFRHKTSRQCLRPIDGGTGNSLLAHDERFQRPLFAVLDLLEKKSSHSRPPEILPEPSWMISSQDLNEGSWLDRRYQLRSSV
jgi:hypothetical protein